MGDKLKVWGQFTSTQAKFGEGFNYKNEIEEAQRTYDFDNLHDTCHLFCPVS